MEIEKFPDNSTIEWFSRETLLYKENDYEVQVEYEIYKTGLFKTGRAIIGDSIMLWEKYPNRLSNQIGIEKKQEIINKAVDYFKNRNFEVNVL